MGRFHVTKPKALWVPWYWGENAGSSSFYSENTFKPEEVVEEFQLFRTLYSLVVMLTTASLLCLNNVVHSCVCLFYIWIRCVLLYTAMNIFMLLFLVQLAYQHSAPPLMDSDRRTGSLIGRVAEPLMHVERRLYQKGPLMMLHTLCAKSLAPPLPLNKSSHLTVQEQVTSLGGPELPAQASLRLSPDVTGSFSCWSNFIMLMGVSS